MLTELKDSVKRLSEDEYTKFRDWLWEYENEKLDKKITEDSTTGKLQALANNAIKDLRAGNYSEL